MAGLVLVPLFLGSCHRRPQAPAAPPPPNYLEMGDQAYEAGDYPAAIADYSAYLREHRDGPENDRVLFRLGLASALPSNPSHDAAQAIDYLNQLTSQFPTSPLRTQAELLANFQLQIQQLQREVEQRESQIAELNLQMEQLSQQRAGEMARLQEDLKSRESRIRQLSEELEKLKAIDMQRRPAAPQR